jgi:hypothetical protein
MSKSLVFAQGDHRPSIQSTAIVQKVLDLIRQQKQEKNIRR